MTQSREHCLLIIHPDIDQQHEIAELLRPLGREIITAVDLRTAAAANASHRIGVVVCRDIRIPMERDEVVESIRKNTIKIPVIVLIDEPIREKCSKATTLLAGESVFLVWPDERDHLAGMVRAYLGLAEAAAARAEGGIIDHLRQVGRDDERREVLEALERSKGNVSRAANALGISRGGLQHRMKKHGIPPPRGNTLGFSENS